MFQIFAEAVDRFAEDAVGLAFVGFEGANLIDQVVDDVAHVHGVEHAEAEVDGELESWFAGSGLDAVAVLEEQDAKAVKTRVLQGKTVLGFVHAEAAGPTGSGGEEDEVIENLLASQAFFLEELQVLHEVADGEIRRIALTIVAKLLARLEGSDVGDGEFLATVAAALEDGTDQVFVLPSEAAEQDGDVLALLRCEGTLDGPMKMSGLVEASNLPQARAFRRQPLFDLGIVFNLDEIRRHVCLRSEKGLLDEWKDRERAEGCRRTKNGKPQKCDTPAN